jgi:ribosomal protein S18 acetylase RimI-like enzyme
MPQQTDIRRVDIQQIEIAQQIYPLQQAAYLLESRLIDYPNLPPLHESIETLRQSQELFLAYWAEGQVAGVLSYIRHQDRLEICRLVISPHHFRQGIAGRLLQAVETVEPEIKRLTVSTALKNQPALALYQKYGYRQTSQTILPDGLVLVELQKEITF